MRALGIIVVVVVVAIGLAVLARATVAEVAKRRRWQLDEKARQDEHRDA